MQINTSKSILLITLLLVPLFLSAQIVRKKYVTRSGDTTLVVLAGSTGLYGEDAEFLLDSRDIDDSLDKYSRYAKLKEAVQETNIVANIVEVEKKKTNPSSGSLGFKIAQKNIEYLQREKAAQQIGLENMRRNASIEELAYLYEKFGEKPSYFVNGIPVDHSIVARIHGGDVLTKTVKSSSTSTGNPNGEVWYVVPTKIFERLDIGENISYAKNEPKEYLPSIQQSEINNTKSDIFWEEREESIENKYGRLSVEQRESLAAQQREVEELKKQLQIVKERNASYNTSTTTPSKTLPYYPEEQTYTPPKQSASDKYTPPVKEEVVSFRDSPQERSRRNRDANITEENVTTDENITDDTPVRSVRRIKDRQRVR